MKRFDSELFRRLLPWLAMLAAAVATPASATIIQYSDWEGLYGTSGTAIHDQFYDYEQSSGSIVAARTPISGDPAPRAGQGLLFMEIHTTDGDFGSSGGKRIESKMNQSI